MWALCPNTEKCSITSLQFQVRHAMMLYEPCHQLCSAYWCMIAAEMAKREGRRTPQRHRLHLSTKSAQSLMSSFMIASVLFAMGGNSMGRCHRLPHSRAICSQFGHYGKCWQSRSVVRLTCRFQTQWLNIFVLQLPVGRTSVFCHATTGKVLPWSIAAVSLESLFCCLNRPIE